MRPNDSDLGMERPNLILEARMRGKRKLNCYGSLFVISGEVGITSQSSWTLVVSEFPDVFPNELPGIARDREIEFCLDLVPSTQPIFIPLYHMTLAELTELRKQLDELIEKGFIHPSTLPWGAPIFFAKKPNGSLRLCGL